MTQIERYSQLMKVKISRVKAHVAVHLNISGSVLAGTIKAGAPKVVTDYQIESPDDPSKVAAVLRNARNGCWVRAAVSSPVPFEDTITLNGSPLHLD
jgi:hypothetical protein